jgi:peroxiredoxin
MIFIFAILLLISCNESEYIPDKTGKEILTEYSDASSNLKSIEFKVHYLYDNLTDEREAFKDTVNFIVKRNNNLKSNDFPFEVSVDYMDNIDIIYNDNVSYFIDHDSKLMTIGHFDSLGYVLNIQGNWIDNVISEMILPNDISQLINGLKDTIIVEPIDDVNGKECYVIYSESYFAQYDVTMQQRTWIDVNTKLPVRSMQQQISKNDTSKMIADYFVEKTNFELEENALDISKYSDYEKENYKPRKRKELFAEGTQAPNFELVDHTGETVSLSDYKNKVVLIDFWGTWCVWCVRSFPKLEQAYSKLKDKGVEFLGVSCQEPSDAKPVKFARDKGISYPILLNGDEVAEKYNISGYPTFYIIDQKGKVILAKSGFDENLDEIIVNTITPYLN